MQFCNEHGIPHSVFLEEWSEVDRAKALAYIIESNLKCPLCGTAEWEWEENRQAYVPQTKQCWGCYYREVANENERNPGESIGLVKNTQAFREKLRETERRLAELNNRDGVSNDGKRPGHKH